ncbi:NADH:flavin oxidoreductase/NADH oxidase [Methylotenera mobilis]|uniref:NADH:flavin oxidoreductase/NADH oxidase n=1 Tax=Methylotenera mobilis (strain JLW8 / ATCC BAA-1282 / DSM 17540) TaxID=583345 RepID=C6WWZ2_METML|nr:NADH:flavin oxidoreductase/NADH oxidase [Methylotenera mobilis]ACT48441.1 NADH:flavin oxidoreductase/NADH oxidase [Methylotenera mobilis JLW8]
MNDLFTPYQLKDVTLKNRIAIPPMCQYMADDGLANDWHKVHYTSLARGGSGLVIVEATAVAPEGRITPHCLGIWNDEQAEQLREIAAAIKAAGAVPGIQIAHAGRKASANVPWEGDDHIPADHPDAWPTIAPSAIAFGGDLARVPSEMTIDDIKRVQNDFALAAQRALDAGFEWLELHLAHGYMGQSFFSPHSNKRTDEYGGSYENRARFSKEMIASVRKIWPDHLPLTARFGVLEYDNKDEETLNESIQLINEWKQIGLDMLSVSVGFTIPETNIPWGPAFLAPIAERVRNETQLPVSSAWGFGAPKLADQAVRNEQLDLVMIGRAHLENPNWSYQAAKELGIEQPAWVLPPPYAHWLSRYRSPTAE